MIVLYLPELQLNEMFIIGTTGHIDHGKSSLVKALTSIDPDRLPEEKQRGMSIDLGFAWMALKSGEMVGFIDVPGHKDLMKNVIAGLWGINASVLVVAADDGWMPQTEEHIQILDFFGISHAVVAITKIDAVDDADWIALVEEDIRKRLQKTRLAGSPIVKVSATLGTNLESLKEAIADLSRRAVHHTDKDKPRLYIDRVFTITGSGTVVTGTLIDGSFNQDQKVTIYPRNLSSRIRGIESYKQKVNKGLPGSRVALNLMGIKKDEIQRGDIVFSEAQRLRTSIYINGSISLPDANPYHLKDKAKTIVHLGTSAIPATIRLLRTKILHPGESGFAQLQLKEPVDCRIGDRFILRRPSPAITIGGGTVLDPMAEKLRSKNEVYLAGWLEQRRELEPGPVILTELEKRHFMTQDELLDALPWEKRLVKNTISELKDRGLLATGQWVLDPAYIDAIRNNLQDLLAEHHKKNPLGSGMTQAELITQTGIPKEILDYLITTLVRRQAVRLDGNYISLSTHTPSATSDQETLIRDILELFSQRREFPPTRRELAQLKPGCEALIAYLCRHNQLVDVGDDILMEFDHYQDIKNRIIDLISKNGSISIQTARKQFGFTRKFILPIFNKLDHEGITMLVNNERVFSKAYRGKSGVGG